jgi:hypothetical protein
MDGITGQNFDLYQVDYLIPNPDLAGPKPSRKTNPLITLFNKQEFNKSGPTKHTVTILGLCVNS